MSAQTHSDQRITELRHRLQDARDQVRLLGRASEYARENDSNDQFQIGRDFMAAIRLRDELADELHDALVELQP